MAFNPTKSQEKAITAKGNVLVSAAAGSGKTAVLVERVISKLCDKQSGVSADKLLIVTFTNAAAAEMRSRIEKRLDEVIKKNPDDKTLLLQKHLLPSAKICTIDSFCIDLVRENFEKLGAEEKAELERNNTHFDYYGKYAIAFSKTWCEQHNFQPIHYLNKDSHYTEDFRNLFQHILTDTDVLDQYVQDVINRLSYIKPLRGIMKRKVRLKGVEDIEVELYKNFHDEREWRYVPKSSSLEALSMGAVIANPKMVALHKEISQQLEDEKYNELWLKFSYDDIRYIIVPDAHSRINIIKEIMDLPMEKFDDGNNIELQKQVLISKILVLDEIRRDW